jgi:hypothetical protein
MPCEDPGSHGNIFAEQEGALALETLFISNLAVRFMFSSHPRMKV